MTVPATPTMPAISFEDLNLHPDILKGIQALGYEAPTDVQARAVPLLLEGRDLIIQSSTGTGKTMSFGFPLLHKLKADKGGIGALVLCPTRELAVQVCGEFERIDPSVGTLAVYGGDSFQNQVRRLQGYAARGEYKPGRTVAPRIVVGTPGRVRDHIEQGTLDLSKLKMLVLDEADEMLDMGFREDLEAIMAGMPDGRQTVLVSATMGADVFQMARKHLRDPERVSVSRGLELNASITHCFYEVRESDRYTALVNLLHYEAPSRAVIFCHTRRDTEEVSTRLTREGFKVGYLSGELQQAQRNMTMDAFRRGDITLLVATDVAARGLDVQEMTHVINFHVPQGAETYVHRTGRTGRAGRAGEAWTLVAEDWGKWSRLVREVRLQPEARTVPDRIDVQSRRRERMLNELVAQFDGQKTMDSSLHEVAQKLLQDREPQGLVADLLSSLFQSRGGVEVGYDITPPSRRPPRPPRPMPGGRGGYAPQSRGSYRPQNVVPMGGDPEIVRARPRARVARQWDGAEQGAGMDGSGPIRSSGRG